MKTPMKIGTVLVYEVAGQWRRQICQLMGQWYYRDQEKNIPWSRWLPYPEVLRFNERGCIITDKGEAVPIGTQKVRIK